MSLTFKIENMTLYVAPMPASMPQVGAYYGELHHERVVYPIARVWGNSEEEVRAKLLALAEHQLKAREVMRAGGTEALAAFLKQR